MAVPRQSASRRVRPRIPNFSLTDRQLMFSLHTVLAAAIGVAVTHLSLTGGHQLQSILQPSSTQQLNANRSSIAPPAII